MGSRINSVDSLCDLGGQLPGTMEQIKHVTDNQEAVMAFYYKDSSNQVSIMIFANWVSNLWIQVKMMEIFDVTETDPSLLVKDQFDYDLDSSKLRFTSSTLFLYLESENIYIQIITRIIKIKTRIRTLLLH